MKSSIQNRIKLILVVALGLVIVMGSVTMYYFTQLYQDVEWIYGSDFKLKRSAEELKQNFFNLEKIEKNFLKTLKPGINEEIVEYTRLEMSELLQNYFTSIEENLKIEKISGKNKAHLTDLQNNLKEYQALIKKTITDSVKGEPFSINSLQNELKLLVEGQDKLINAFMSSRYRQFQDHQEHINNMITNAKRNLFLLISLGILTIALIIYLAPQHVVRPIRTYINGLRELQDLKFDVRLPIYQKNELGKLGQEINAFIDAFLDFDTMKVKKIQFEKRKLQVLADILNLGVVIVSIEGDVLFMNAQMASVLHLSSENFHKKDFHFVRLPDDIKLLFEDAILKKEKFENRMVIMPISKENEEGKETEESVELLVDAAVVRNYIGEVANVIFTFEDISNKASESIFKRMSFYHKEAKA